MHVSTEKIVDEISRWENEGEGLSSEWMANRESFEREQEIVVSAETINVLKKSEAQAKAVGLGKTAASLDEAKAMLQTFKGDWTTRE
jgi:predicted NUDIX family NTP pyrophosphohydrolase